MAGLKSSTSALRPYEKQKILIRCLKWLTIVKMKINKYYKQFSLTMSKSKMYNSIYIYIYIIQGVLYDRTLLQLRKIINYNVRT